MSALTSAMIRLRSMLNHGRKQLVDNAMPHVEEPDLDQALVDLTYSHVRFRPGMSVIVNGQVNIARFRDGGKASWHWGAAHVHSYGTSVIGNELRSILKDPAGTHDVELKLEYDPEPSLFDEKSVPSRIVFQYLAGPKVGRAFWFEPVPGDEDGWSEMVGYAQQLISADVVQRVCHPHEAPVAA